MVRKTVPRIPFRVEEVTRNYCKNKFVPLLFIQLQLQLQLQLGGPVREIECSIEGFVARRDPLRKMVEHVGPGETSVGVRELGIEFPGFLIQVVRLVTSSSRMNYSSERCRM